MDNKNWLAALFVTVATLGSASQIPLRAQEGAHCSNNWFSRLCRRPKPSPPCVETSSAPCVNSLPPATTAPPGPSNTAPAETPENEETANTAGPNYSAAPALFSAPPAGGEITGATNGYGFRFPGLTIPEIRLQPVTFHMPNIVRTMRDAEMYVEGGRAPRIAGAPAAYGPLMNAAIVPNQVANTAPAKKSTAPAKQPPSTAPAETPAPVETNPPVKSCTPFAVPPMPPVQIDCQSTSVEQELIETRRALSTVSERLQQLQRKAGGASNSKEVPQEAELPPSPTSSYRRATHTTSMAAATPKARQAPKKIVEASYSEDEFEDVEEEVSMLRPQLRRNQGGSGIKPTKKVGEWLPVEAKSSPPKTPRGGAANYRSTSSEDKSHEIYEDEVVDGHQAKSKRGDTR